MKPPQVPQVFAKFNLQTMRGEWERIELSFDAEQARQLARDILAVLDLGFQEHPPESGLFPDGGYEIDDIDDDEDLPELP